MTRSTTSEQLMGRIGVVTGASAGIGRAIATHLARAGASVVVNARREGPLAALAGELGPKARAVAGDCADESVISEMLDAAVANGGREADLVVVNAGRGLNGSSITSDPAEWAEMIRTNVLGAAHLIRAAGLRMLKASEGKVGPALLASPRDIIVIGSVVGRHVSPFSSMYGATKFAVHGLVEGTRRELGPKGIRVTLIEPGFVESEFQGVAGYDPKWVTEVFDRIGPVLQPDDVARMITFVASQPANVHVSDILLRPTRQDYP
ncbi:MAG: SDR family oxidoreductase [bacterium]|nr:SDR family oxidoreductase [bacterium]